MKNKYPENFDNFCIESEEEFELLSAQEQVAVCIHMLESEVNNGGFHQLFSNSSGLFILQTLNVLSIIRANKTKKILNKAIKIAYQKGYPAVAKNHGIDLSESDETYDLLEDIDQQFYNYEDDLTSLVNNYLSNLK